MSGKEKGWNLQAPFPWVGVETATSWKPRYTEHLGIPPVSHGCVGFFFQKKMASMRTNMSFIFRRYDPIYFVPSNPLKPIICSIFWGSKVVNILRRNSYYYKVDRHDRYKSVGLLFSRGGKWVGNIQKAWFVLWSRICLVGDVFFAPWNSSPSNFGQCVWNLFPSIQHVNPSYYQGTWKLHFIIPLDEPVFGVWTQAILLSFLHSGQEVPPAEKDPVALRWTAGT